MYQITDDLFFDTLYIVAVASQATKVKELNVENFDSANCFVVLRRQQTRFIIEHLSGPGKAIGLKTVTFKDAHNCKMLTDF